MVRARDAQNLVAEATVTFYILLPPCSECLRDVDCLNGTCTNGICFQQGWNCNGPPVIQPVPLQVFSPGELPSLILLDISDQDTPVSALMVRTPYSSNPLVVSTTAVTVETQLDSAGFTEYGLQLPTMGNAAGHAQLWVSVSDDVSTTSIAIDIMVRAAACSSWTNHRPTMSLTGSGAAVERLLIVSFATNAWDAALHTMYNTTVHPYMKAQKRLVDYVVLGNSESHQWNDTHAAISVPMEAYTEVVVVDFSTAADTYTADMDTIQAWMLSPTVHGARRAALVDARATAGMSLQDQVTTGRMLLNYYEYVRLQGGGLAIVTGGVSFQSGIQYLLSGLSLGTVTAVSPPATGVCSKLNWFAATYPMPLQ